RHVRLSVEPVQYASIRSAGNTASALAAAGNPFANTDWRRQRSFAKRHQTVSAAGKPVAQPSGRNSMIRILIAASVVAAGGLVQPAFAQDKWPEQTITIVVPFSAGAINDRLARIIAEPMAQILGQPVVVENR